MAHMHEDRRSGVRNVLRIGLIVFLLFIAVAVILWVFQGGEDDAEAGDTTPIATIGPPGVNTPDCEPGEDTGSGEWELKDLHGDDGSVLNGGIDDGDLSEVMEAAKHDPLVLRTIYIDLKSVFDAEEEDISVPLARVRLEDSTPSVEDLECVEARMALWNKLDGIVSVSSSDEVPMEDLAEDADLPRDPDGNYRAPNTSVNGDDVGTGTGTIPPDEQIIETTMPNGAKAYHRTFCANKLDFVAPPAPGKGRLEVIKTDDGSNVFRADLPVPGVRIIIDGPEHREAVTDGSGLVWFNDLTPGTYTVREIVPDGWEPVTPATVTVEIKADEIGYARFKNRQVREEVPTATATNTPSRSASSTPTATKTPVGQPSATPTKTSTPVKSATPTSTPRPPTQTPEPRPTTPPDCCPPSDEPDFPFPEDPNDPTPVNTEPVPTVRPPQGPSPTPRPAPPQPTAVPR